MTTVVVVAALRAKAGAEADLERALRKLVKDTHREPGCVIYALHQSEADPRLFIFVEKWATRSALDAHLASPHVAEAVARKDEWIESIEIWPLVPLGGGDLSKSAF